MVSCEKWLNIPPDSAIADDELFSTGYGFRNSLNGIYLNIASDKLYGRELSWGFLSAISQQYIQTDDIDTPLYQDAAELKYNTISTEPIVEDIWKSAYKVIANINKLLNETEEADNSKFKFGKEEKELIKAEALGLRAMLHFDLLRLFAPSPADNPEGEYIPYKKNYFKNLDKKLSVNEFLDNVIGDLNEAEKTISKFDNKIHPTAMYSSGMPNATAKWSTQYRFSSSNYIDDMGLFFWFRGFRMNIMSIIGLKARVYMYAGPKFYSQAVASASELYNVYYKQKHWIGFTEEKFINANIDARFTKLSTGILMGLHKDKLAQDYSTEVWRSATNTVRLPLANIDELFASDNTGTYSDLRFTHLIGRTNETESKYYSLKYQESQDKDVNAVECSTIPIIRLSEISQILAEISAYNGNIDEGIKYLTELREARGARRSLKLTVKTKEELMNEIIQDIRKESIGEGRLFFEYKRLNIKKIKDSATGKDKDMTGSYVLPIPASETI